MTSKHRKPTYEVYMSLSQSDLNNLVETNYFLYKHKLPLIEVPPYDLRYHKSFAKALSEKR